MAMGSSKTSGLLAARKLRKDRKKFRRSSYAYRSKQSHKKNIFNNAPMAEGVVVEKKGVEAKQPNSAIRKAVVVQLIKNRKKIAAFVPLDGGLNFIEENDKVTLEGIGKRNSSKGDIPGLKYRISKVCGVSLKSLYLGKKEKPRN